MGGGGGGGGTIESIPDWYKPFVETAAGDATKAYQEGQLGQVAGWNALQQQAEQASQIAANQQTANYNDARNAANITGQVAQQGYNSNVTASNPHLELMKQNAIRDAKTAWAPTGASIANAGATGGARAALLQGERDAALASSLAGLDYGDWEARQGASQQAAQASLQNAGALNQLAAQPAQSLQAAGAARQQQEQAQLDAPYTGLAQLGSLLSGAPVPGQSQKAGGK